MAAYLAFICIKIRLLQFMEACFLAQNCNFLYQNQSESQKVAIACF